MADMFRAEGIASRPPCDAHLMRCALLVAQGALHPGDYGQSRQKFGILLAAFGDLLHTSRGVIPGFSTGGGAEKGLKRACLAPIGALR